MQLNLAFPDSPGPSANVLATLEHEQRLAALEVLARLIAQTVQSDPGVAGDNHD